MPRRTLIGGFNEQPDDYGHLPTDEELAAAAEIDMDTLADLGDIAARMSHPGSPTDTMKDLGANITGPDAPFVIGGPSIEAVELLPNLQEPDVGRRGTDDEGAGGWA